MYCTIFGESELENRKKYVPLPKLVRHMRISMLNFSALLNFNFCNKPVMGKSRHATNMPLRATLTDESYLRHSSRKHMVRLTNVSAGVLHRAISALPCRYDVELTSMRRNYVVSTSVRRHMPRLGMN